VTDGLDKNRDGVFIGLRDRRLTFGFDWAQREETIETGANTGASPRATIYLNLAAKAHAFLRHRGFVTP
jgi:hypothetical protein